jgi:hypothetical protein
VVVVAAVVVVVAAVVVVVAPATVVVARGTVVVAPATVVVVAAAAAAAQVPVTVTGVDCGCVNVTVSPTRQFGCVTWYEPPEVGTGGLRVATWAPPATVVVVAPATVVVVAPATVVVVAPATVVVDERGTVVVVAGTVDVVVVVDGVLATVQVKPFGLSVASNATVISTFQYLSNTVPADLVQAMPRLYVPAGRNPGANSVDEKLKPGSVGIGPGPLAVPAMLVVTLTKRRPLSALNNGWA